MSKKCRAFVEVDCSTKKLATFDFNGFALAIMQENRQDVLKVYFGPDYDGDYGPDYDGDGKNCFLHLNVRLEVVELIEIHTEVFSYIARIHQKHHQKKYNIELWKLLRENFPVQVDQYFGIISI